MKVLHVITGLHAGGAEQQLRMLLRHRSAPADVVALSNAGVVADGMRADGVRVHLVEMSGNRDLGAVLRLARLIRRGGYDVVHTHLYRACVYGRIAARLAGVRTVVATEHSLGEHLIEGRPVDRPGVRGLYRATERLGRVTVAVSDHTAARLRDWGVRDSRITVLRNGTDLAALAYRPHERARVRERYGIAPDRPVVGAVGRLDRTKHLHVLVAAFARLPGVTGLVVGEGPERSALLEQARAAGVADRIVFTGETDDVPAMLCAMDALASPSPAETFGLALLEAAAAGLPIAYASGPVLDDLVGDTSRIRSVRTDADDLASALSDLLDLPRDRRPHAGLDRYDVAAVAHELDDLYHRLTPAHLHDPEGDPMSTSSTPAPPGQHDPAPGRNRRVSPRTTVAALVLLVTVVLGAVAGAAYGLVSGPTYRATAYIAVAARSETDGLQRASNFASAYGRIATDLAVLEPAGQRLGVTPADVSGAVTTQTSPDAPLIEISGTDADPAAAAEAANAVADSLATFSNARQIDTGVTLAVFAPAVPPIGPASASVDLLAMVGAAAGFLLAALGLFAASQRGGFLAVAPAPAPTSAEAGRNGSMHPSQMVRQ